MVRLTLNFAAAANESESVPPAATTENVVPPVDQASIDSTDTDPGVSGTKIDRSVDNKDDENLPADQLVEWMNSDPSVPEVVDCKKQFSRYCEIRQQAPGFRHPRTLGGILNSLRQQGNGTDEPPAPQYQVIQVLADMIDEAKKYQWIAQAEWAKVKKSRPCCLSELNRVHEPHEDRDRALYKYRHLDCKYMAAAWRQLLHWITLRVSNLKLAAEKVIGEAPVFSLRRSNAVRRKNRDSPRTRDGLFKRELPALRTQPEETSRKVSFDPSANLFGQEHRKRKQCQFRRSKPDSYRPGKWAPGAARLINEEASSDFPTPFSSRLDKFWTYNDTFLNTSGYRGYQNQFFGYDDPVESVENARRESEEEEQNRQPTERRAPVFKGRIRRRRGSI